jgi:hypothetical protein
MTLATSLRIATVLGAIAFAGLVLAAIATSNAAIWTFLADAATYVGAILLGWLLMQEKALREFTFCTGAVLMCGLGASFVLNQSMFAAIVSTTLGALILGALFAPTRWKPANVLALRAALAALLLGALTPLAADRPSLASALGIWATLGLFWGWRLLAGPKPQGDLRADRA